MAMERVVCRFSCGAASAVATKLAIRTFGAERVTITCSDTGGENPDNARMRADCERWFGQPVLVKRNERYADHMDVWEKERFIKSQAGASCRGPLKQEPWLDFDRPDDILVIGYTAEEQHRVPRLRKMLFEKAPHQLVFPCIEAGLTKEDCLALVERQGIKLPAVYLQGYKNNNCIGCCKRGKGYWNKIRVDYPDHFERAARIQRSLGTGARFWIDSDGKPIMLDELDPNAGHYPTEAEIECSIFCQMAEQDMAG